MADVRKQFRKVKSRTFHVCKLCKEEISQGGDYFKDNTRDAFDDDNAFCARCIHILNEAGSQSILPQDTNNTPTKLKKSGSKEYQYNPASSKNFKTTGRIQGGSKIHSNSRRFSDTPSNSDKQDSYIRPSASDTSLTKKKSHSKNHKKHKHHRKTKSQTENETEIILNPKSSKLNLLKENDENENENNLENNEYKEKINNDCLKKNENLDNNYENVDSLKNNFENININTNANANKNEKIELKLLEKSLQDFDNFTKKKENQEKEGREIERSDSPGLGHLSQFLKPGNSGVVPRIGQESTVSMEDLKSFAQNLKLPKYIEKKPENFSFSETDSELDDPEDDEFWKLDDVSSESATSEDDYQNFPIN